MLASFVLPSALVVGVVLLLVAAQQGLEASVSSFSEWLPVGYAFGAGMVASVNPCGFFLLPSYVSYQLGVDEEGFYDSHPWGRAARALVLGGTATAGFVVLFASVGGVLALGGTRLVTAFPYAGVAIGALMAGLGIWLAVTRRTISVAAPRGVVVAPQRNQRNVFLFGIGYAIASLCCTLPIFLVVVFSGLAAGDWLHSFSQFVGYGLGMGMVLVSVTVGTAMFRGSVARWFRRAIPYVHRSSSFFLIGAGVYILYYWLFYADFFF